MRLAANTLRVLVFYLFSVSFAVAHEIEPIIADVKIDGARAEMSLRLSAEAVLSELDLSQYSDTRNAPQDAQYDALRALPDEELAAMLSAQAARVFDGFVFGTDQQLIRSEVEAQPNLELARDTLVTFSAAIEAPFSITWPERFGDVVLRIDWGQGGEIDARYIAADQGVIELDAPYMPTAWQAFVDYIPVGFDHIIPKGLDHILFVIGLFLMSFRFGDLLWQISAFTLAHTITLALSATGVIVVSGAIVEPLIAASIAFVALENLFSTKLNKGRIALVFGFGLLHGMGFASVLGDFGLPAGQFVAALIGFNVGVELGQIAVVLLCWLILALPFGAKPWYRAAVTIPLSLIIAAIGLYWVYERVFL